LRRYTENAIARIRVSPEGQEGLRAFLQKRPPSWQPQPPPRSRVDERTCYHHPAGGQPWRNRLPGHAHRQGAGPDHRGRAQRHDRDARHSREADIRVDLGGSKAADSYPIDKLIAAAKASGAQAIHPGYGFLSENAGFARAIEQAGLIFLGPPASAIDAMGSKSAAKALMETAGVPLVPAITVKRKIDTFRDACARIGYPVLLKATAGGGGKGMKVVEDVSQLAEALASAQREAQSSFGDSRMLVEKYLLKPRHVEIQVFADQHGNCLYLNERDCSIQRRHQKVVEEAPAPGLTPELRRAMGEAAVRSAQAIGYVGAGTVEFLLDARGEFFFMEMNTRLQVEHPVTEAITGLDLVAWQIRVARGEALPITQDQVPLIGHAIEVRLYAEDRRMISCRPPGAWIVS
jgi:3-methylcrotonyl-CoA carboxylase alpha subunit